VAVTSLARAGGNLTGITNFQITVTAKRLELLHELVPAASSIALLTNPANALLAKAEREELQVEATVLGVRLLVMNASHPSEFERAFETLVREQAGVTRGRQRYLISLRRADTGIASGAMDW
jgi:putative tryptophan/tyrosine transport system substrate-binding protein